MFCDKASLSKLFKNNAVVIVPTDTCYGFSCLYNNKKGIERIIQIKGRSPDKPFSLLFSSVKQLSDYCDLDEKQIDFIASHSQRSSFILKKKEVLKDYFPEFSTVCVRIENDSYSLRPTYLVWGPIITTSVNLSWERILKTREEILEVFADVEDLYFCFDEWYRAWEASTIWDLTSEPFVVLRA